MSGFLCDSFSNSFIPTPCGHKICLPCLVTFVKEHSSTKCAKCACDFSTRESKPTPILSQFSSKTLEKKQVEPNVKKHPVVREPGNNASLYEEIIYKRKLAIKKFNDNKGQFMTNDGDSFSIAEYHIALKNGEINKDFDNKFFCCHEHIFLNPDNSKLIVYIPKFITEFE
jgi:hypothetical protein